MTFNAKLKKKKTFIKILEIMVSESTTSNLNILAFELESI